MKYSKDGYKRNSKDVNNPYNIIPSGNITMKGVDFPVMGTDNFGNQQLMMPGGEYIFPGNSVYEVPLQNFPRHFQIGGGISDMTTNLRNRDYDDRRDKPFAQDGVEFSVCDSRERLPNGTFLPGCQGGGYRESVVRPYAGFGITSGKPSDKEYTASGRVSAGVAGYLNNSPFMTHLGVNAGGRFNYENNEAKINPLFNATGSVGVQGNFKIGRKEIPVGAGVYGSQDLRNDTGLTTGFYGTLGKFAAKFGYNPTTGEKMGTIGFGLPIRQTGGSLAQYQDKGELKSGVNSFVSGTPIQDQYDDLITINELGAGNSRTFTDDNRHNTLINKMINRGTHGYNPKTGALMKLDTPLKGLSTEEEFMGTRAYAENVASGNYGFTSKKQDAQIKKLPKEQQEKVTAANYNLRKNLVGEQNKKMVQNPLFYAPGVIAAIATGVPALAAAGEATFAGAAPYVAAAWNTSIPGLTALEGATFGNAINAGFATHGAMNIGPDVQNFIEDPSWEGAGKVGMDALEIFPVVGPAFRTGVEGYTAAKNVGKILKNKKLSVSPNAVSSVDDVAINLESQIAKLKEQQVLTEESVQILMSDYKAGKISAEEYKSLYKELNPDPFNNPRYSLENQLRQHNVKQDIIKTPQQNILTSESQLGKNISDGGTNNKGVFELGNDYVARLSAHGYDDASRLVNYADKIKSPRIAKTLQVKELNGKVYQVQQKVTGTPMPKLSKTELQNIPKEHIDNFWKDKAELDNLGLSIDISGGKSNIFYDPKKGFQFIDLGIGESSTNEVIAQTYKGLKLPGSPKAFKSSLDWGKFNKEIPGNKPLMKEYNAIEQQAKADGTWMKNSDGSKFAGTPEQFVQQQSKNFKKAFPNPVVDDAGNIQINYHGSGAKFNIFDPSKFYSGQFGKGVYTSPLKDKIIKSYANPLKKRTQKMVSKSSDNETTSNLYELYINSKNPQNYDEILDAGEYVGDIRDFGKVVDDLPSLSKWKKEHSEFLKENTFLNSDEKILRFMTNAGGNTFKVKENFKSVLPNADFLKIPSSPFKEQVTPFSNRMKSAIGNDGMFDMTKPNINQGVDGNFLTRPLTPFDKNELTLGKQLYRKIGNKKGLKDLIDKGGAQAPAPMRMNSGATVDTPFFGVGKKPNENYGGLFAVETSMPSKSKYAWSSNVGGTRNYGVAPFDKATGSPVKNIPLDDLEVFRRKWFSNSYKKLDKGNLQKELKSANLQEFSEKLYKLGIRGYLADQILNDGDLTGGKAIKIIEDNFKLSSIKDKQSMKNGGSLPKFQDDGETNNNIVPLKKEGKSKEIEAFGYKGYFDFSQEPIKMDDDQDGHKGYMFVYTDGPTAGGSYWRPLENKYSGGRWEESGQIEEYDAYFKNPNLIDEHWDKGSAVALKIKEAVKNNVLYNELPEYLKEVNTWRTISPNRNLKKELKELDKKQEGDEISVNFEDLEKGIRYSESLNGVLMKNPQSSASGYYGDLYDNLNYDGTRDEFIKDTNFQKEYFKKRYNGEIKDVPGLESNGIDLYNEYKDITGIRNFRKSKFNYTPTEIAALSNMLGRQGTRDWFGKVLRDGESLETVFPKLYGNKRQLGKDGKPLQNKTPDEYIKKFNEGVNKKIGGEFGKKIKRLNEQLKKYNTGGMISPLAYQELVKLKMIKPKMQTGGRSPYDLGIPENNYVVAQDNTRVVQPSYQIPNFNIENINSSDVSSLNPKPSRDGYNFRSEELPISDLLPSNVLESESTNVVLPIIEDLISKTPEEIKELEKERLILNREYKDPTLQGDFTKDANDYATGWKDMEDASEEEIIDLQENLEEKGYDIGSTGADGDYGDKTYAAHRAMVDDANLDNSSIGRYYKKYRTKSKKSVKKIQEKLVAEGYMNDILENGKGSSIDGKFGDQTKEALDLYNTTNVNEDLQSTVFDNIPSTLEEKRCAAGMCTILEGNNVITEALGVKHKDAWDVSESMELADNSKEIFNIYSDDAFNNINSNTSINDLRRITKEVKRKKQTKASDYKIGDIVGIYWDSSKFHGKTLNSKTYNTHIGFVSDIVDGVPIITHNVSKDGKGEVRQEPWSNVSTTWIKRPDKDISLQTSYNTDAFNEIPEDQDFINNYETYYDKKLPEERKNKVSDIVKRATFNANEIPKVLNSTVNPEWLKQTAIGITGVESGFGNKATPRTIQEARDSRGKLRAPTGIRGPMGVTDWTAAREEAKKIRDGEGGKGITGLGYDFKGVKEEDISLGISKIKFSTIDNFAKQYFDVHSVEDLANDDKVLDITAYRLTKNYELFKDYAKQYPELGLTELDIRNMAILSHNQGPSNLIKTGRVEIKDGKVDKRLAAEEVAQLREVYDGMINDYSSKTIKHLDKIVKGPAKVLNDLFGTEYKPYIRKVNDYSKNLFPNSTLDSGETTFAQGGEYGIFNNYVNGLYKNTPREVEAEKIYDKLNRVHYKAAKGLEMSSPNYILTHVYKS